MDKPYVVVAVFDNWSYDAYEDLPPCQKLLPVPTDPPSGHILAFVGSFEEAPTGPEIGRPLVATAAEMESGDGFSALRSHAVLDGSQWRRLAGNAADRMLLRSGSLKSRPSPVVGHFPTLADVQTRLAEVGSALRC